MLRQKSRMGNKSPHPPAISIAMSVRRCDTKCISRCSTFMMAIHRKSLDAAIGQLLAPYCLGGCQGNIKQNSDDKCTNFAVRFDGRGGVPVLS